MMHNHFESSAIQKYNVRLLLRHENESLQKQSQQS